VANTGTGRRLHQFVDGANWRALSTLLLLGPSVPLLFQGQEAAVDQPFRYFADHKPPLAAAVQTGRLEFLSQFPSLASPETAERLPDPADESSFNACRLDWKTTPAARETRSLYTDLIALRHGDPVLSALGTGEVAIASAAPTLDVAIIRYTMGEDERLVVINLGQLAQGLMNDPLFAPPAGRQWELAFCSEQAKYGGHGVVASYGEGAWRLQAHCAWLFRPRRKTS
jgi:maltooligosyltrehalose trehalohydrolase